MICSLNELHQMDLAVHIHTMDEWNEDTKWDWQPATVILQGFYTRVIQEDGIGGLHVATYVTNGEGDLRSLRVFGSNEGYDPRIHSEETNRWIKRDHACGTEYIYHKS